MTTRLLLAIAVAGCANNAVPTVRFANTPPIQIVNDRRDVPDAPALRRFALMLYHFDGTFLRAATRALEVPRPQRAQGVNALDEVPDSTWFTNRIGVREMTADELRAGPTRIGSPEPHKPWTIIAGKTLGKAVGFTIKDARGEKFLLKFEKIGLGESETTAGLIANRLMWGFGYNVAEEYVVYFRTDELILAADAVTKDAFGTKHRLDQSALDGKLAKAETDRTGQYRAMASRILDGKVIGGHPAEGVREDDPNDHIAHERRRDLRGAYPLYSWLDNPDVKEDNSLDMWVADPLDAKRHYVKHYLIDFGKSLGFMATSGRDLRRGYEYAIDFGAMLTSFVTGGLNDPAWKHRSAPHLRGVGVFDVNYDPGAWKANTPAYVPFLTSDRFDKLWGAKILIRFTREQLRAVVESARLTDPRAVDYLVDTLVTRQRATASYWFARVSPLDRFSVEPQLGKQALCFDDLALVYQLGSRATTRYRVTTYDSKGRAVGATDLRPSSSSRMCIGPLTLPDGPDAYTMVRIETERPGSSTGIIVHLARDPAAQLSRVIGIWRL